MHPLNTETGVITKCEIDTIKLAEKLEKPAEFTLGDEFGGICTQFPGSCP